MVPLRLVFGHSHCVQEAHTQDYQACLELRSAFKMEGIDVPAEVQAQYFGLPATLRETQSEVSLVSSQTSRFATNLLSEFREVIFSMNEALTSLAQQLGVGSPLHSLFQLDAAIRWLNTRKDYALQLKEKLRQYHDIEVRDGEKRWRNEEGKGRGSTGGERERQRQRQRQRD